MNDKKESYHMTVTISSLSHTMNILKADSEEYNTFSRRVGDHRRRMALSSISSYFPSFRKMMMFFVLIVLSFSVSSCTSRKTIINGLEERDANEIVVFLSSKGIEAYKIQAKSEGPGGGGGAPVFDISVDSDKSTEAMSILNANGLPRRRPQNLLELFNSSGLVPSEMQEKIRFQSGLAAQIAGTIRKIDGILDADVQLSFPEEDPLNPQNKKGAVTASVFIKHQGVLDDPNSQLITKIRRLVASSVQGLSFDNVTVIADKGRFSDTNALSRKSGQGNNVELIKVWSVVVAKESVGRFQTIFLSIVIGLFITTGMALWLFWKIMPVARSMGGIGTIFSSKPFVAAHGIDEIEPTEETDDEDSEPAQTSRKEQKGKKAQENIESP